MPVRHVAVALGAAVLVPAGTAAAAPSACPPGFRLVDATAVIAELAADGQPLEVQARVESEVFARVDRNGNGTICQQVGSYGRAPGLPDFFSNFRDDRRVG